MSNNIHSKKLPVAPIISWEAIKTGSTISTHSTQNKKSHVGEPSDVFTVDELGHYLKIGRNSTYDLIHANLIHYVRIGKQIRISKQAVDAFLMGQSL